MIFVAIPLPGTGAWSGALVAAMLDMQLKRAFPAIAAGVLIAGIIVTSLTYGISARWRKRAFLCIYYTRYRYSIFPMQEQSAGAYPNRNAPAL